MEKECDFPDIRELVEEYGHAVHIMRREEENIAKKEIPDYKARRWVVERAHSWMNRFRRMLIRWEKKSENYFPMLHLACA